MILSNRKIKKVVSNRPENEGKIIFQFLERMQWNASKNLNNAINEDEKQRATSELDSVSIVKGLAHEDQGHVFSDKLVAYLTQDESPTYCKECDDKVVPPTENHRPAQVYYHKKEEW